MDSGETSKRSEDEADAASGLRQAAIAGDKTLVRKLLGQNQDTTAQSSDASGRALLRIAVEHARLPIIPILLDHGADIETLDSSGRTALHQAVGCNDVTLSKLLLNWGANVEATTSDGEKPLWIAAKRGTELMAKALLERGADVESFNAKSGTTALFEAVNRGHVGLIKLLLESGADIDARPLVSQHATIRGDAERLIRPEIPERAPLVCREAYRDHGEMKGHRPEAGHDHNDAPKVKSTSLLDYMAGKPASKEETAKGHPKVARWLAAPLKHHRRAEEELTTTSGGKATREDGDNESDDDISAMEEEILKTIRKRTVRHVYTAPDPVYRRAPGHVYRSARPPGPVHGAPPPPRPTPAVHLPPEGSAGSRPVAAPPRQGGVPTGQPHADREVPLYQAVMNGDVEVVKLLLQHGADTGIPGKDGRTAQQVADQQNLKDLAALLRSGPVLEGPAIKSDKAKQRDVPLLTPPPLAPPRNNPAKIATCHVFEATIIEFYTDDDREQRYQQSATIYDLLYGRGPQGILIEERPESLRSRQADFTWYHLPANNMEWVEGLVTRLSKAQSVARTTDENLHEKLGIFRHKEKGGQGTRPPSMKPHCREIIVSEFFGIYGFVSDGYIPLQSEH